MTKIEIESEATATMIFVEAFVPASFDADESRDDYAALDDALGPWGGYGSAVDIERVDPNTIHARFERDL
jgi:hypothetical protein